MSITKKSRLIYTCNISSEHLGALYPGFGAYCANLEGKGEGFHEPIAEKIYEIGIVPVIAFNSVDEALPLCRALSEGGLSAAEVTFRTPCAEACIRLIHKEMPDMLLGAGTVPDRRPGRPGHGCRRFLCGIPRV